MRYPGSYLIASTSNQVNFQEISICVMCTCIIYSCYVFVSFWAWHVVVPDSYTLYDLEDVQYTMPCHTKLIPSPMNIYLYVYMYSTDHKQLLVRARKIHASVRRVLAGARTMP